jgi:hypothetical protein
VQPAEPGARLQRKIDSKLQPSPTGVTAIHVNWQVSKHVIIPDGLFLHPRYQAESSNAEASSVRPVASIFT